MAKSNLRRSSACPLRAAFSSCASHIPNEAREEIARVLGVDLPACAFMQLEAHIAHLVEELTHPDPREVQKDLLRVKGGENPLGLDNWRPVHRLLDIEKRKAGVQDGNLTNADLAERAIRRVEERADVWSPRSQETLRRPKGNRVEPMRERLILCAAKVVADAGLEPKVAHSSSQSRYCGHLADLLEILFERVPALRALALAEAGWEPEVDPGGSRPYEHNRLAELLEEFREQGPCLKVFADRVANAACFPRQESPLRLFYPSSIIRRAQSMYEAGQLPKASTQRNAPPFS